MWVSPFWVHVSPIAHMSAPKTARTMSPVLVLCAPCGPPGLQAFLSKVAHIRAPRGRVACFASVCFEVDLEVGQNQCRWSLCRAPPLTQAPPCPPRGARTFTSPLSRASPPLPITRFPLPPPPPPWGCSPTTGGPHRPHTPVYHGHPPAYFCGEERPATTCRAFGAIEAVHCTPNCCP